MLCFVDGKHLTKVLRKEKQYTVHKFLKEFPNKKWSLGGLNYLLGKKWDKFGCVVCFAGSVQPWSMHNAENIVSVSVQSR